MLSKHMAWHHPTLVQNFVQRFQLVRGWRIRVIQLWCSNQDQGNHSGTREAFDLINRCWTSFSRIFRGKQKNSSDNKTETIHSKMLSHSWNLFWQSRGETTLPPLSVIEQSKGSRPSSIPENTIDSNVPTQSSRTGSPSSGLSNLKMLKWILSSTLNCFATSLQDELGPRPQARDR